MATTADSPPPSFYNCCKAEVYCDENGEECAIKVSCHLRDRETGKTFEVDKTIDLRPLIQFLMEKFKAYHASLHGDTNVAGLGSFLSSTLSSAKNAAKRIASSKGVKALWDKVKPLTKEFIKNSVPGGAATFALAEKTYDVVNKARKGDTKALNELKSIGQKAIAGNPLAKEVMKTAKILNNAQKIKELKGRVPAGLVSRAVRPLETLKRPSLDTFSHRKTVEPSEIPEMDFEDEAAAIEDIREMAGEGADITDLVEGWRQWLYSKQYRTPVQSMLDMSPGIGMGLRSLYSDGVDTLRARALAR